MIAPGPARVGIDCRAANLDLFSFKPEQRSFDVSTNKNLWRDVYQHYREELDGYLRKSWGKNPEDAEDIVQQAFVKYMAQAPNQVKQPRAFLFQVVKNLARDIARKTVVRDIHQSNEISREIGEKTTPALEEGIIYGDTLENLKHIIQNLPKKQRRAFILRRFHHLSYQEIASDMKISSAGVKKHITRALATCQQQLDRLEQGQ